MNQSGYRLGLMHGALLVALVLVLFVALSHAQNWIVGSGLALHLDGEHHCNSFTSGLGFEKQTYEDWSLAGGFYDNSNCKTSAYLAGVWRPLHLGRFRLGAIAGLATGYRAPVVPAGGAVLSYETRRWGLNLIFIPPLKESGNVAWLQFKVPW